MVTGDLLGPWTRVYPVLKIECKKSTGIHVVWEEILKKTNNVQSRLFLAISIV